MWQDIRIALMLHPLDGFAVALDRLSALRAHLEGSAVIAGADVSGLLEALRHAAQLPMAIQHEPLAIVSAAEQIVTAAMSA